MLEKFFLKRRESMKKLLVSVAVLGLFASSLSLTSYAVVQGNSQRGYISVNTTANNWRVASSGWAYFKAGGQFDANVTVNGRITGGSFYTTGGTQVGSDARLKENIQYKLYELLKNTKGIDQARKIINNNLNDIDNNVKETLQLLNYELGYDINFGLNYFPSKEYKGVTYDEGYYESLVITLGEGKGDNWWCVLFPPLCLLEAEESTEVEYTSFVKELLDKYL